VIAVRPYAHNDHYWQVYFYTNAAILRVDREAGWSASTPTHHVHTFSGA
jgi:small conductance mechanosensitive channel